MPRRTAGSTTLEVDDAPGAEADVAGPAQSVAAGSGSVRLSQEVKVDINADRARSLSMREAGRRTSQPLRRKVRHRKVKQGVTIFKGHPSWNIMMNLKLGIAYTVGRLGSNVNRPLTSKDFKTVFKQVFPPEGSATTPAHSTSVFTIKDHAPLAFRHLREHFGVDERDYIVSLSGEHSLRELGTPGKSGAVFYLSEDYKFLFKTVSKKESKFLRRMLPNYYAHALRSTSTLLPRFFGLFRITTAAKRNIRMVVMNNLLPEETSIHEKFDLKGSTLGRYATESERKDPNVTLKDLDFQHMLRLPPKKMEALSAQLESDCDWLRALRIMDYSLLAMLHFPSRVNDEEDDDLLNTFPGGSGEPPLRGPELTHQDSNSTRSDGLEVPDAMNSLNASPAGDQVPLFMSSQAEPEADDDVSDSGDEHPQIPSSERLPKLSDEQLAEAYANSRSRVRRRDGLHIGDGLRALIDGNEEVILFCGIIDVLQQYGARKQLEHRYKSIRYSNERAGISVTDPASYAERFVKFVFGHLEALPASHELCKTFAAEERETSARDSQDKVTALSHERKAHGAVRCAPEEGADGTSVITKSPAQARSQAEPRGFRSISGSI
mmetsp:Transcript_11836/g.19937  ORF Transcript_11836/g.19937 Transcript_11836/m.19937 type:complete len:605 (+) Transcript_11836:49-1863(+)|eukprot:CAMPEP_0119330570 /NCGR_PEP_ID=MMETSP1333-20130426/78518_1 /TAXON_ID=418940 /ORGANISM="Scyphosphaera apsteinii, Strain RCC1455" /LENGTH=604 /DNA_ID=CAMNT_0007339973 /DNA_START=45 /DNA_END=1859 /DNA_ORIENTATION=+